MGQHKPQLLRAATYLPVGDVQKSMDYYQHVLGFGVDYAAGDPPEFAICSRDGLSIMLRRVTDPDRICPSEAQGGTWDVFFWADDAKTLYAQLTEAGAEAVYGPVVQKAYQMLEFAVRDCDGHVLGFGQAL